MANESVAIPLRSINPVPHLSYLIKAALQGSCNQSADFHENYRRQFATLIGLGFTAMLAEGSRTQSCQLHLFCIVVMILPNAQINLSGYQRLLQKSFAVQ